VAKLDVKIKKQIVGRTDYGNAGDAAAITLKHAICQRVACIAEGHRMDPR
jgi:hypothetical protein